MKTKCLFSKRDIEGRNPETLSSFSWLSSQSFGNMTLQCYQALFPQCSRSLFRESHEAVIPLPLSQVLSWRGLEKYKGGHIKIIYL